MWNTGFTRRKPNITGDNACLPRLLCALLSLTWEPSTNQNNCLSPIRSHRPLHQKLVPIPLAVYGDANRRGRSEIHNKLHNKLTKKWTTSRHTIYQDYTEKTSYSANQCFNKSVYQSGTLSQSASQQQNNQSTVSQLFSPLDSRGGQFYKSSRRKVSKSALNHSSQ